MGQTKASKGDRSKQRRKKRRQVFVAYSYRLYPRSDYRNVYKQIEKSYDVTFIFADEKITNMHIMKKIESFIRDSDFAIFDISGWNPNVTLELGFAMALNEQWYIAIDPSKTEVDEVPSDLRGLDRIQYGSYSELGEKIQTVMAQRYPRRQETSIDTYLAEQRKQVVGLLRSDSGLTVTSIAQLLGVDVQVAQLIVRPLVEEEVLRTEGVRRATKYFIVGSGAPRGQIHPQRGTRDTSGGDGQEKEQPMLMNLTPAPSTTVKLNEKESAVLALLQRRRTPLHLEEIGATCFRDQNPLKANSWARNSIRKLLANSLVVKVDSGIYSAV
jgi:predicted nucleotide-binding protein